MDSILPFQIIDSLNPILAAGGIAADQLPSAGWLTNSIFVAIAVLLVVLLFTRMATKRMRMIPGKKQNFVEFVVEFLYGQVEGIVGKHVAPKAFPLLATIFVFILVSNYSGLIPGVGTIGFGETSAFMTLKVESHDEHADDSHGGHGQTEAEAVNDADRVEVLPADAAALGSPGAPAVTDSAHPVEHADGHSDAEHKEHAHFTPLLRPPTADLNLTLGIALVFMVVWAWITIREIGVIGFLEHTFAPKGGLEGFMKVVLVPIFLFVGVIEIISIVFRPVSLSFRLLGNIYAGETLLHMMGHLGEKFGLTGIWNFLMSVILPLPFYFMEILVGLLQAVVFTLLCAVYIQLSTSHDEEAH